MSKVVYRIVTLLSRLLCHCGVGTNLGLLHLMWALVSGRFLSSRGAVFSALADMGLPAGSVRRASAALRCGRWRIETLLAAWQPLVRREGRWQAHQYEGFRPVACDLVGFFRPSLKNCTTKHYQPHVGKALPALPFGIAAGVGSALGPGGETRLPCLRHIVRQRPEEGSETSMRQRLVEEVAATLSKDEVLVVDAGFPLAQMIESTARSKASFVARLPKHATARRNYLPPAKGRGRQAEKGERVRPLEGRRSQRLLPATPPDETIAWQDGRYSVRAHVYRNLVLPSQRPGALADKRGEGGFMIVVFFDPRFHDPLLLATNLTNPGVSPPSLWALYRDRWPIEQIPLAAKQMLGTERQFVFGQQSRWRLPELAMLTGNVLAYAAATSAPVATGFWDRQRRPTCGRLRRALARVQFSELPQPPVQLREKRSVSDHLPKGVEAHRRKPNYHSVHALQSAAT